MKRTLIGAIALLLAAGAVSCSSSKKASGPAAPAGMVEEAIPLSGAQYRSNAEYYRAVQNGVSTERSTAQKIAMQNCRQDLAAAIQADVKLVIENYVKNQDTGVSAEHKSQYQELAYTAVGQQLRDVQVVEEKMFRQDNGSFRYYVCMQLPWRQPSRMRSPRMPNSTWNSTAPSSKRSSRSRWLLSRSSSPVGRHHVQSRDGAPLGRGKPPSFTRNRSA